MSITQLNTQTGMPKKQTAQSTVANFANTSGIQKQFQDVQTGLHADALQSAFKKMTTPVTPAPADIGTQMRAAMQQPRTAQNVNHVSGLLKDREAKIAANPALAQYADDDINKAARLYTSTPGYRDDMDYAAQIQQLAAMPATAENQKLMRELNTARMAKIAAGGEPLAQYADDDIAKMAQNYLKQYVPGASDMGSHYDRADTLADENYNAVENSLRKQYEAQVQGVNENYDRARRAADLNYAVRSRNMENILAEQGLGRGLGAGPSSGYSETARMQALADYNNAITDTYRDQDAAVRELAAQLEASRLQAMFDRNAAKQNTLLARAEQANADRNFELALHQYNAGLMSEAEARDFEKWKIMLDEAYRNNTFAETVRQFNESFGYQKERDAVEDAQWAAGHELDKYNTYKKPSGYDGGYVVDAGNNPYEDVLAALGGGNVKRTVGINDDGTLYEREYLVR